MNDTESTLAGTFITTVFLALSWSILGVMFDFNLNHGWATARGLFVGCLVGAAAMRLATGKPVVGQTVRLWRARRAYYRDLGTRAAMRITAGEEPDRAIEYVRIEMAREASEALRL